MLTLVEPLPVKVFAGMLWSDRVCFASALAVMEAAWGECDVRGEPVPFTVTDYYVAEMGAGLQRQFVAFETLVNPDALPTLKLTANRIEADSATAGQRRAGLDQGRPVQNLRRARHLGRHDPTLCERPVRTVRVDVSGLADRCVRRVFPRTPQALQGTG